MDDEEDNLFDKLSAGERAHWNALKKLDHQLVVLMMASRKLYLAAAWCVAAAIGLGLVNAALLVSLLYRGS